MTDPLRQYTDLKAKIRYLQRRNFKIIHLNKKEHVLVKNKFQIKIELLHDLTLPQLTRIVWIANRNFAYDSEKKEFYNEWFQFPHEAAFDIRADIIEQYNEHIKNLFGNQMLH